ncbi:MAG TPA: TIGR00299 family protein, partial [Clostridiales bacterium]|nr:TIGR00299 family protein [Clostridiales bacterium]
VHFHEVGMLDALADIVGVCLLMDQLAPDQVLASPIHVGSGQAHCAHGILPVPAPATAYILRGVPTYGGSIRGELCTPTGAALLRHFVDSFGDQPVMAVSQIGYGMGKKDFSAANCVRAMLGETQDEGDQIAELCCNLDDMTPEAIAFAQERLLEAGALDVFTTPIGMKKSRPGILFSCLCLPEQSESMARIIFHYTRTLGIRRYDCQRYTLTRSEKVIETAYGKVRVKKAAGWGVRRSKAEYEDVAAIARATGLSIDDAQHLIFHSRTPMR